MDKRKYVLILSDIHMGISEVTDRYHKEVHEKYLMKVLNDIVIYSNQIQEVILLGDIFEFWFYPPKQLSPTIDDIIAANPNILGPNGKLRKALNALQGRMVFLPGDHDRNITRADLYKIKSTDGYTIKYYSSAYIPSYDTKILFTHGHDLNSIYAPCVDIVVMGYSHFPFNGFCKNKINYVNIGFICSSNSGCANQITYEIYDLANRNLSSIKVTDIMPHSIQPFKNTTGIYEDFSNDSSSKNIVKSEQINENPINKDKPFTFGWSVFDESLEFWSIMQDGVLSKAKELGINIIKHDEKSDSIEMITGSIDLIRKGVNALLIAPYNPEGLPFIVAEADKNQIPVVVLDTGTGGANVAAFIVSDSFGGGIYAGEYALILIKKYSIKSTNVAILKVQKTAKYALLRGQGFSGVMIENGYTVVAEVTANSIESQAYEATKNILTKYGDDLAVIFCENGTMTLGAAKAIEEAGKKGKIMLIGFDSGPSIIAGIKNGSIQGTIAQEPFLMGELSVEVANSLLIGIPVTYDDIIEKIILMEVYLIDENGDALRSIG